MTKSRTEQELSNHQSQQLQRKDIILFLLIFITAWSHWYFTHGSFGLLSPGKASCDSHATQPTVHAGNPLNSDKD